MDFKLIDNLQEICGKTQKDRIRIELLKKLVGRLHNRELVFS